MRSALLTVGWVLLGLLVIAGAMISAGRQEDKAFPAADSYGPSGTSALAALLRDRGYRVEIDRADRPMLAPGDTAIAFLLDGTFPGQNDYGQIDEQPKPAQPPENPRKPWIEGVKGGATVFWIGLSSSFQTASLDAKTPQQVVRRDGKSRSITSNYSSGASMFDDEGSNVPIAQPNVKTGRLSSLVSILSWPGSTLPFASAKRLGEGYDVDYSDGLGLTNRFLDKNDNAQAFLETLATFARPGSRIVFTEASFGNSHPLGLLRTIGDWAEAAWFQLLFLFGVVIFTLNRRFGLPERYRPAQKGTRELLDAVTDTMVRARATGAALEASGAEAEARLRSILKLPRDAGVGELYRLLPESLINAMTRVRAAAEMPRTPPGQAFLLIQGLEKELDAFLLQHRPQAARRRRAA